MTVIHANDPTTQFLSLLYETRGDLTHLITETSTNSQVFHAIRDDDTILMLGHGNQYGLFSKPNNKGKYERFMITDRHVEFLRGKICIGIWCYANQFAERYGLHGLFSGMIISELQEAEDFGFRATKEEIDVENVRFALNLKECIDNYGLEATPLRMSGLCQGGAELVKFNYGNFYYL